MDAGIEYISLLALTGICAGFASGLLGVGGSFIMVPMQLWLLASYGIDPTISMRIALATSLAVIMPTAMSGALGHCKRGAIDWDAGLRLGASGALGAFAGGSLAAHLSSGTLRMAFGIVVLFGAARMFVQPKVGHFASKANWALWGIGIGFICGITGIGGGVIIVPVMVMILGIDMHRAVGTSSFAIVLISMGGVLSYILSGLGAPDLPPHSLGYVNLVQWAFIAGTSVPSAQLGVVISHKLPGVWLRRVLVVLMLYTGLKMMGILGGGLPI